MSDGEISEVSVVIFVVVVAILALVMLVGKIANIGKGKSLSEKMEEERLAWEERPLAPAGLHVTCLSLGIDWRSRREIQSSLIQLAQSGRTGSPEGLAELMRETTLVLRRSEMSWLYASFRDLGIKPPQEAEPVFKEAADDARSRFRSELVRARDGEIRTAQQAHEVKARPEEGPGTVVVTIVAATRRKLSGVAFLDRAESIQMALRELGALTAHELAVMEVIWSPAAEDDRLSTAELEHLYPELRAIDPESVLGRVICAYCGGPYSGELLRCPHCDAPSS